MAVNRFDATSMVAEGKPLATVIGMGGVSGMQAQPAIDTSSAPSVNRDADLKTVNSFSMKGIGLGT